MNKGIVLTFDIGTQSIRGMFIDEKGNILDIEQKIYEVPYFSKNPGWAEQKPDFYFDNLCNVSKILASRSPKLMSEAFAVTITTLRDTVLCLDKDLNPLRDIVLWLDKREAKHTKRLSAIKSLVFNAAGVMDTIEMQHRQSVCNWIMDFEPEIWSKTSKYVMLSTYLNYKMTGVLKDTATNQVGHVPFDYKNRRWMKENGLTRCLYDIPNDMLCEIVDSGTVIGKITPEMSKLSGIPEGLELIASGSDKGCETLGLSVTTKNKAALSFGTTATIHFTTPDYFEPMKYAPAYPAVPNNLYNAEVQIYRGYWMLSWFKKEFAAKECEQAKREGVSAESLLNKHLCEVPAGCDGLILQPYWSPGIVNPNAKGAIIGFSDCHTRAHLYRAIIEGINYGLMDSMYAMQKRSGQKITEIFIGGGGSQSEEICQITSSMFGLPVKRIQTHEVSGLGSSIVAFVAKGIYKDYDEALANMVRVKDTFYPDFEEHELYMELYKDVYCQVYNKLEPLYKRLKRLLKRE